MPETYFLRIKDTSGTVIGYLDHWSELALYRRIDDPGSFYLVLDDTHPDDRIATLSVDYQLEVFCNHPEIGVSNRLEFEGLIRDWDSEVTPNGRRKITASGPGYLDFLKRRIIAYPSGHSRTQLDGVAENLLINLVNQNLGPNALPSEGRYGNGVMTGLSVAIPGGGGSPWTGARAYKNLLSVCQEISVSGGVDFDIVGTGPGTFEFRVYLGQRGTDRSTIGIDPATGLNSAGNVPVVFSLEKGNMSNPKYSYSRREETNRVYATGQGIEDDREVLVIEDAGLQADSPWNLRETQMDSRNEVGTDGLTSAGETKLVEGSPELTFGFDVLQIPSCLYGKHYFVGDKITAVYNGVQYHRKITGADIFLSTPKRTLNLYMATLPGRV